jgi:hypothetical protein
VREWGKYRGLSAMVLSVLSALSDGAGRLRCHLHAV